MTETKFCGVDRIRLILALNRAWIVPFSNLEWSAYAGASGDAQVISFHKEDDEYFREALGIKHWHPDTTFICLDETGITWNGSPSVNAYAYQVRVAFNVEIAEQGTSEDFWEVQFSGHSDVDLAIAELPDYQRELVLACPESARPYVLHGLGVIPDPGLTKIAPAVRLVAASPPAGLVHDYRPNFSGD